MKGYLHVEEQKQQRGIVLMLVYYALCLLILWQYHKVSRQLRIFSALLDLVEEKKQFKPWTLSGQGK